METEEKVDPLKVTIPVAQLRIKPFYKTSEFWLTLLGIAANHFIVKQNANPGDPMAEWIGSGIATGAYAVSRGLAKSRTIVTPPA